MTLIECLQNGPVDILFTKADGSQRQMLATTNHNLFNYQYKAVATKNTPGVIRVWDLLKEEWRSIRQDRIINWVASNKTTV